MATYLRIWNSTSRSYGRIYGNDASVDWAVQQALGDTAAQRGDAVAIEEVTYEMRQQGERMIAGSSMFEPRMIETILSYAAIRTGTIRCAGRHGYTVKWQA
jgi:hypothetical protein